MAKCKYHYVCGLTDEYDEEARLCILHSHKPQKDPQAFDDALATHRKEKEGKFARIVFPADISFAKKTFDNDVNFYESTFKGTADFNNVTFAGGVIFGEATFTQDANFAMATFTHVAYFGGATFTQVASFLAATFPQVTHFIGTTFTQDAHFSGATFTGDVTFCEATFTQLTSFLAATFTQDADFTKTTFTGGTTFRGATFTRGTTFRGATFTQDADFIRATFSGEGNFAGTRFPGALPTFRHSRFSGRVLFTGTPERQEGQEERAGQTFRIFQDARAVDFRDVILGSPESLSFRQADFQTCQLLNTDLRKIELTGVLWPQRRSRRVVYDEEILRARVQKDRLWNAMPKDRCTELCTKATGACTLCEALAEADLFLWGWLDVFRRRASGTVYPWDQLERLYRELKQNYEDRRNYAAAGDFHYSEKEMQRLNPTTRPHLKVFLWLYRGVSGYGERLLRPLLCALVLLVGATAAYLWLGLVPKGGGPPLQWTHSRDWGLAIDYGLRVMTLLRPDDLVPIGYARYVHTLQNLLGPLILGLFALAVRQRLKH